MPAIIYQKTPGGLFATGERTVSTFPSGLVRVDQTFICPTSDAANHRADLAVGEDMPGGSAPAIDGLKIFPEPQEKKLDNGFTEFVVSAYGRVTSVPNVRHEIKIMDRFFWGFSHKQTRGRICIPDNSFIQFSGLGLTAADYGPASFFERYDIDYTINTSVLKTKNTTMILPNGSTFSLQNKYYRVYMTVPSNTGNWQDRYFYFWMTDPYAVVLQSTNFGSFKEIEFEIVCRVTFGSFLAPVQ
jgi:hypothetical protein